VLSIVVSTVFERKFRLPRTCSGDVKQPRVFPGYETTVVTGCSSVSPLLEFDHAGAFLLWKSRAARGAGRKLVEFEALGRRSRSSAAPPSPDSCSRIYDRWPYRNNPDTRRILLSRCVHVCGLPSRTHAEALAIFRLRRLRRADFQGLRKLVDIPAAGDCRASFAVSVTISTHFI